MVESLRRQRGRHRLRHPRHPQPRAVPAFVRRRDPGGDHPSRAGRRLRGRRLLPGQRTSPGWSITTSGPAVFNVAAAAGTAYAESRPLLIISPGLPRGTVGGDAGQLHETKDASGAMDRIVAWSRRVETPEEAAAAVTEAFAYFAAGRPRPVHIEIPLDVLEQPWNGVASTAEPAGTRGAGRGDAVGGSRIAGRQYAAGDHRGRRRAGCRPEIRLLAELLGAPVITTCNGKGVLAENHPLSVGASIRLPAALGHIAARPTWPWLSAANSVTPISGAAPSAADGDSAGHRSRSAGQESGRAAASARRRRDRAGRTARDALRAAARTKATTVAPQRCRSSGRRARPRRRPRVAPGWRSTGHCAARCRPARRWPVTPRRSLISAPPISSTCNGRASSCTWPASPPWATGCRQPSAPRSPIRSARSRCCWATGR